MKFQELKKSLQETIFNVYLIRGKDSFLREKAENMISNSVVKDFQEFNIIKYNDETFSFESFITNCQSMPMMSDKKAVILKDVTIKQDKEIQLLVDYCKKPTQSTCLIIVDSVSSNTYKDVVKYAELVDCNTLDENTIQKIVVRQFADKNITIELNALNALLNYCNLDLMRITNETLKLIDYVGNGGVVKFNDVDCMVYKDIEYSIFELGNAVAQRNGQKALNIINNLLQSKEQPQTLLMLIQSTFRRMFYTISTKMTNKEIADLLGVKEYSIKISRETATRFSPIRLKYILDFGAELDFKIKSGQMDAQNALLFYVSNIVM